MKFLGITFDCKFTFKKHFEVTLGRCNARYHRIRILTNQKWGPSPSTIPQIYKQCVRTIFEYGSLSTITTSDTIISEIQQLQSKFIQLALRLPKYISVKLLHDSSGLPYVKDRLLSRAKTVLQSLQFSWYTLLFLSSYGMRSFGLDNRLLKVVWCGMLL